MDDQLDFCQHVIKEAAREGLDALIVYPEACQWRCIDPSGTGGQVIRLRNEIQRAYHTG